MSRSRAAFAWSSAPFRAPGLPTHRCSVRDGDISWSSVISGLVRLWCVKQETRIPPVKSRRRLRKLVPDAELIRRRAAGEPLRELASDYEVAHTNRDDDRALKPS